ncbi:MAG TPA: hypothetical protein VIE47_06405 [Methylocystis sp.]|jgi:hypothetical protein
MKIKAALFVVALMAAMLAPPVSRATAMPRLDPDIVKIETPSHIEKAWWRYYYRPHYYHRWRHYYYYPRYHYYHRYHYYRHYHYYHRWRHYRRWHHWHRRYWW